MLVMDSDGEIWWQRGFCPDKALRRNREKHLSTDTISLPACNKMVVTVTRSTEPERPRHYRCPHDTAAAGENRLRYFMRSV